MKAFEAIARTIIESDAVEGLARILESIDEIEHMAFEAGFDAAFGGRVDCDWAWQEYKQALARQGMK